jgi:hypothetical protein
LLTDWRVFWVFFFFFVVFPCFSFQSSLFLCIFCIFAETLLYSFHLFSSVFLITHGSIFTVAVLKSLIIPNICVILVLTFVDSFIVQFEIILIFW